MPTTTTTTKTMSIGSVSFVQSFSDTGEVLAQATPTVAAAKTGTLTTRTDADTGTLTMTTGHGFSTGDKIDLYWSTGSRYNVTCGTVATNSVPIDLGSGDNLPIATTAITAMKPTSCAMVFTGNNAVSIATKAAYQGCVTFFETGDAIASTTTLTQLDTGEGKSWSDDSGETNPLAGKSIVLVKFSHADSSNSRELGAYVVQDV